MIVTLSRSEWKQVYRRFAHDDEWAEDMAEIVSAGKSTGDAEFPVDIHHQFAGAIGILLNYDQLRAMAETIQQLEEHGVL